MLFSRPILASFSPLSYVYDIPSPLRGKMSHKQLLTNKRFSVELEVFVELSGATDQVSDSCFPVEFSLSTTPSLKNFKTVHVGMEIYCYQDLGFLGWQSFLTDLASVIVPVSRAHLCPLL